jgi:hypothetical protein
LKPSRRTLAEGQAPIHFPTVLILLSVLLWTMPVSVKGLEIDLKGFSVPQLSGMVPYSITVRKVDGVEKVVEKFYTPGGGHVARISGDGKVFAYAVDHNREPPIDYLLVDPDGSGKFIQKLEADEIYSIPSWVGD